VRGPLLPPLSAMTVIMTARLEPPEPTGRLTYVQRTECENDPRSPIRGDVIRRVTDYMAGYADARVDKDHAD
jgi:hypothetical protein